MRVLPEQSANEQDRQRGEELKSDEQGTRVNSLVGLQNPARRVMATKQGATELEDMKIKHIVILVARITSVWRSVQ